MHRVAERMCLLALLLLAGAARAGEFEIRVTPERILLESSTLAASIRLTDYVSGVEGGTFLDKRTGLRDVGYGLDIVDWVMEAGADDAYRGQLPDHMVYHYGNAYHGQRPKRSIEGPQICTKAGRVEPQLIAGADFLAVRMQYQYTLAAPGRKPGSMWTQNMVFPAGQRYFVSSDRIDAVNAGDEMFLRIDMPGHIKHQGGDTFSEIYLSYHGRIPSSEFTADFAPDERFNYRRDAYERQHGRLPERMIRAYRIRDKETGRDGPWLAGMTLNVADVYEAWCHQRGYVCLIEEIGGRRVAAGESFGAAFIVGFFDSIEDMHAVYDQHRGASRLEVSADGWRLTP